MSASRRSKSSPFDSHAGFSSVNSLSSTISPVGKSSHQSVMPLSHCPHCLCPRFLSATKSSGGNGRIMVSGRPSQKEADLPLLPASARSIPVSVIQRISFCAMKMKFRFSSSLLKNTHITCSYSRGYRIK